MTEAEKRRERDERRKLREACREAYLFMTAPADSLRLLPESRGALTRMLAEALGEESTT